jgi:predicted TPR repeat methyltransferase
MPADVSSSGDLIADRRYAYARALLDDGDAAAAADLLRQTLELTPRWHPAWFSLGEALLKTQARAEAITAFQHAAALDPGDVLGAKVRLAHLGAADQATAMTADYVAALFDQYAHRFDDHLTGALEYRGPAIILEAIAAACASLGRTMRFARALDLGCGTGLMAEALGSMAGSIAGIDLSPAMVAKARQGGRYDHVACGDLIPHLGSCQAASIDLLTAADVLVYISALEPLFAVARRCMAKSGLFAFTVQSCGGDGYQLGNDLRYHHSERYLRRVATGNGLDVIHLSPCVTRKDAGKAVPGLVAVLG